MGAWGVHSYENDSAADLLAELSEAEQPYLAADTLRGAFEAVLKAPATYLDADLGSVAIAGAEVVAAALGHARSGEAHDPLGLQSTIKDNDDLMAKALAALRPIRSDRSELAELWAESDDAEAWRDAVADLEVRLRAAAAAHGLEVGDVSLGESDPEDVGRREVQQIYDAMMAEIEKIADKAGGDPQVEMLRHLTRKLHLIHSDVSNMRHAVTDSLDALMTRLDALEGRLGGAGPAAHVPPPVGLTAPVDALHAPRAPMATAAWLVLWAMPIFEAIEAGIGDMPDWDDPEINYGNDALEGPAAYLQQAVVRLGMIRARLGMAAVDDAPDINDLSKEGLVRAQDWLTAALLPIEATLLANGKGAAA